MTSKQDLRERVWDDLEASGVARFPFPPHGRIPNYAGASEAADRLASTAAWRDAETIKANPDAPQLPVRRRALRDGKRLYVAVPRLRDERCFLELDPAEIDDYDAATTVSGISTHGVARTPDALPPIDLIVAGSVAVSEDGGRIGKGEGYSDIEWAVLSEFDRVDETTSVVTSVHERQIVPSVDADEHDVRLDHVVTADRTISTDGFDQPSGIDWSLLSAERIEAIPVLAAIQASRSGDDSPSNS
ncbi:5-formyltetrahydrofolate cyclo-ligase [Halovivax gelatinilyticus]|uniref:5-formyltetrahydrofolate cyclo-ligase n=1 Tax=Halovivax gelatinilyticus TaxID=2961597 RepID=UPI0020CA3C9F|nr:5-formyltetrahydrofolate cyclo-ligase [Halovivax gelatinilyticus]